MKRHKLLGQGNTNNTTTLSMDAGPAYLMLLAHQAIHHGDSVLARSNIRRALRLSRQIGETCLSLLDPDIVAGLMRWYRDNDKPNQVCIKIYTLGRFAIEREGKALRFNRKVPKRPLELLKVLIACGNKSVQCENIADMLWPDAQGDAAQYALKTTLNRLRNLLGIKQVLICREGRLSLNPDYCWVDCWSLEEQLQKKSMENNQLGPALDLYQGDFLAGDSDNHCFLSRREQLREHYIKAVIRLGKTHERERNWLSAIEVYQRGLHVDGLAEPFYRGLMRSYQAQGQRTEAIKTYQRCGEILESQLGISPSRKTRDLYEGLRK